MTPTSHNAKELANFKAQLAKFSGIYTYKTVTYAVLAGENSLSIISAKLEFTAWPAVKIEPYESDHIRVGQFSADDADLEEIIALALAGRLQSPIGDLLIDTRDTLVNQNKSDAYLKAVGVLRIPGSQIDKIVPYPLVTTELNAGVFHYSNLSELLREKGLSYGLGAAVFEIVLWPMVRVLPASSVRGREANLSIELAAGADHTLLTINGRGISEAFRPGCSGGDLTWVETKLGKTSAVRWNIPKGEQLRATVSYKSVVQVSTDLQHLRQPSFVFAKLAALKTALGEAYSVFQKRPIVIALVVIGSVILWGLNQVATTVLGNYLSQSKPSVSTLAPSKIEVIGEPVETLRADAPPIHHLEIDALTVRDDPKYYSGPVYFEIPGHLKFAAQYEAVEAGNASYAWTDRQICYGPNKTGARVVPTFDIALRNDGNLPEVLHSIRLVRVDSVMRKGIQSRAALVPSRGTEPNISIYVGDYTSRETASLEHPVDIPVGAIRHVTVRFSAPNGLDRYPMPDAWIGHLDFLFGGARISSKDICVEQH